MHLATVDYINGSSTSRHGVTLIEALVLVGLFTILAALLLPAMLHGRAKARLNHCKDNLAKFGVGFQLHADADKPRQRLCTGAYDFRRDGCVDTWGWVADLVNTVKLPVGQMRCPSNALRASETVNDLLGDIEPRDGCPFVRLVDGACGEGGKEFADTAAHSAERAAFVGSRFIAKNYSTNYASSWFLCRTGLRYEIGTTDLRTINLGGEGRLGLDTTLGPLTRKILNTSPFPASLVPLLADAAPRSSAKSAIPWAATPSGIDPHAPPNGSWFQQSFLTLEEPLAWSSNNGPVTFDEKTGLLRLLGPLTAMRTQFECEWDYDRDCKPAVNGNGWLQDTRGWRTVHGRGSKTWCNVLMADGSVKDFLDANGDGYLNPGFPIPRNISKTSLADIGYRDNVEELPKIAIFSGVNVVGDRGKSAGFE